MRSCDGCKFCCWSFNVPEVPDSIKGLGLKPARQHCPHECSRGCAIHDRNNYPVVCNDFVCPYLDGEDMHRPDEFQGVLKELNGNVGAYIPAVPTLIPVQVAKQMIANTRTVPAFILVVDEWMRVILSLDRHPDRTWTVNQEPNDRWRDLFKLHGVHFDSRFKPGSVMA